MLNVNKLSTAGAASAYYQADNYYSNGDKILEEWYGGAAKTIGIKGEPIENEHFHNILSGQMEDGQKLGRMKDGEWEHIAGYDLTFLAPKSVSILTEIVGDQALSTAHDKAVKASLDWVEVNTLKTRIYNKKTEQQDVVGNQSMLAALFKHDLSRNEDPLLHTHCVIANAVLDDKGKWRSIDNPALYNNRNLTGIIYRSELAINIRKLGVDITRTSPDGLFEIAGLTDKKLINEFSTRTQDIEEYLGEGAHSAVDKARAALVTRKGKTQSDRKSLRIEWKARLDEIGYSISSLQKSVKKYGAIQKYQNSNMSKHADAFNNAIEHLSENQSTFPIRDVLRQTLSEGLGIMRIDNAQLQLDKAVDDGRLLLSIDGNDAYTYESLKREVTTLQFEKNGRAAVDPVMPIDDVLITQGEHVLTDGQFAAAQFILTSPNRTIGIQGYAGTGKTFMLSSVARQAEERGYEVLGMAPTSNAAYSLASDARIKGQTLQKYLLEPSGSKKTILFVDEASMITTHQMLDLLTIAKNRSLAKVVLVGDTKQLEGVGAGTPFKELKKAGMRFSVMDEIKRQSKERHLDAVKSASIGDIETAFQKLGDDVREVPFENLSQETANAWLQSDRDRSAVIATTNQTVDSINAHIKSNLQEEGIVSKDGLQINALKPIRLTESQKRFANFYHEANKVLFNKSYIKLGVLAGEALTIKSINEDGTILLDKNGKDIVFKPSRDARANGAIEPMKSEPMEIHAGDQIRWRRKDYANSIENMQRGKIESITDKGVSIKMQGRTKAIHFAKDHPQLSFLSHAWAQTGHAYQGQTVDHIIATMPSLSGLTTQKSFYVDISRARHEVTFITDDIDRIKTTLAERTGDSRSALDLHMQKDIDREIESEAKEPIRELERTWPQIER